MEAWAWERITAYLEEPERVARELGKEAERREDTQEDQSFELDIKKVLLGDIERK